MKTYILQLDLHDDIVSARDKMGWAKAGRILLVWPESGQMLNRRLDLILLRRHSISLGAQLALVSRDREIRYHAPRLGIPVFKRLDQAQSAPWRLPRRFRRAFEPVEGVIATQKTQGSFEHPASPRLLPERPPQAGRLHPAIRVIAFTLGVLAFLSIAAVLLPGAQITLVPEVRSQGSKIYVQASPVYDHIDISGKVPATWKTVIVEGRLSQPVGGWIRVPVRPASGEVTFTNLTDQPVTIPEGTVVRTLGSEVVRFTVTQSDQIPAGPGESLSLPIRALIPGSEGNLRANRVTAIEGLLGTKLSVANPSAIAGGSDRFEPAPSQQDRIQLSSSLQSALEETALSELKDTLKAQDLLIPASLRMVDVLEEDYEPAEDYPADHLDLSLRLKYQALVVAGDDLNALGRMVLDSHMPAGFAPLDETIRLTHLTSPAMQRDQMIHWRLEARRAIQAHLKAPQVIQLVLGQTPEGARRQLAAYLPIQSPLQIDLSPDWWPRLPILPFRILILYQAGDPTAQSLDAAPVVP